MVKVCCGLSVQTKTYVLLLEIQLSRGGGGVGIPLTSLTPPHFYACPKPGPGFPMSHVIVFLCSVSSVKMRGNCSFYWYWWICFPSVILLFYLLYAFFNITDILIWHPSFAMQTKEQSIRWQNLISTWTVHI